MLGGGFDLPYFGHVLSVPAGLWFEKRGLQALGTTCSQGGRCMVGQQELALCLKAFGIHCAEDCKRMDIATPQ